jgi:hypothetical protein
VDVAKLLNDLCVQLGYCLRPEDQQRIVSDPPSSVDAFTDAVVKPKGSTQSSWLPSNANRFGEWLLPPSVSRSDRAAAPGVVADSLLIGGTAR